jgi:hypothetical protein
MVDRADSWAFDEAMTSPGVSHTAPVPPIPPAPVASPAPAAPSGSPAPSSSEPDWDSWYARPSPPPPSGAPTALPPPSGYRPPADPFATHPDGITPFQHGAVPNATRTLSASGLLDRFRPASQPTGPGGPGGPGRPGGPGGRRKLPIPLIVGAGALAAVLIAALLLFHGGNSNSPAGNNHLQANSHPTAKAGSGSTAERQAATALAGLLAQSGTDRGAVVSADVNVGACGSQLAQDARTFSHAAESRRRMMAKLSALPGKSVLPASLVQDLTGAWQASADVDIDLARWARSALDHGCNRKTINSSPYLHRSYVPDGRATSDKQAFISLWNPIARQYGLTSYQTDQL